MDLTKRRQANLSVLRRHDAAVSEIVDLATYVVVYNFDPERQAWARRGVEGTLFVVRRAVAPWYSLVVLNRLALENFTVGLSPSMEIQTTGNYLIYRTPLGG
ncbi:mRNA-decapping enzyme 1B [Cladochytrium tenue]|nr:mRNA-decapping enzyme 1B [Cladochytrium tenue]